MYVKGAYILTIFACVSVLSFSLHHPFSTFVGIRAVLYNEHSVEVRGWEVSYLVSAGEKSVRRLVGYCLGLILDFRECGEECETPHTHEN